MCKCASQSDLVQFSELCNAGIPLDEVVVRDATAAGRGLSIYQVGRSRIIELEWGGAGYLLGIGIRNDSNRVMSPHAYRLELPWEEEQFGWVEPSSRRAPPGKIYTWRGEGPGYPASEVLNHRLGAKGRLFPGDCFEGWLLGAGHAAIPEGYCDRERVRTPLTVFDGRGNRYETNVKFRVNRRAPVEQHQRGGTQRRRQRLLGEMQETEADRIRETV